MFYFTNDNNNNLLSIYFVPVHCARHMSRLSLISSCPLKGTDDKTTKQDLAEQLAKGHFAIKY